MTGRYENPCEVSILASLNTEIKLGGRKKRYPVRKSINLYIVERHTKQNTIALCLFGVYLVCLYLFVQFAVIDQLQKVDQLEQQYNNTEQAYEALSEQNSDYDKVLQEYSHYGNGYLNDDEKALQDRMEILKIAEDQILDKDALESISISGNQATLTINSQKLSNVSSLAADLEDYDIVSYVTVDTSSRDNGAVQTYSNSTLGEGVSASDGSKAAASPDASADGSKAASSPDASADSGEGAADTAGESSAAADTASEGKSTATESSSEGAIQNSNVVVTTMEIFFKTTQQLEEEKTAAAVSDSASADASVENSDTAVSGNSEDSINDTAEAPSDAAEAVTEGGDGE